MWRNPSRCSCWNLQPCAWCLFSDSQAYDIQVNSLTFTHLMATWPKSQTHRASAQQVSLLVSDQHSRDFHVQCSGCVNSKCTCTCALLDMLVSKLGKVKAAVCFLMFKRLIRCSHTIYTVWFYDLRGCAQLFEIFPWTQSCHCNKCCGRSTHTHTYTRRDASALFLILSVVFHLQSNRAVDGTDDCETAGQRVQQLRATSLSLSKDQCYC